MKIILYIGGLKQRISRKKHKIKMFKYKILKNIINKKIGIYLGKSINKFIKSYGSSNFAIRKPLVHLLCAIIAQIDEQEYKKCKGTTIYRK